MRTRSDVQNIDLMNMAGFCRNCLANWYQEAAGERGLELSKDGAREVIYGMPYKDWQAKHQKAASAEQQAAFAKAGKLARDTERHGWSLRLLARSCRAGPTARSSALATASGARHAELACTEGSTQLHGDAWRLRSHELAGRRRWGVTVDVR